MTTGDPAPDAFQRLEQAMDTANDLIGTLIRRLDGPRRPRLRVVSGELGRRAATASDRAETPPAGGSAPTVPDDLGGPQLRVV
jgi:hypothetical protein